MNNTNNADFTNSHPRILEMQFLPSLQKLENDTQATVNRVIIING